MLRNHLKSLNDLMNPCLNDLMNPYCKQTIRCTAIVDTSFPRYLKPPLGCCCLCQSCHATAASARFHCASTALPLRFRCAFTAAASAFLNRPLSLISQSDEMQTLMVQNGWGNHKKKLVYLKGVASHVNVKFWKC